VIPESEQEEFESRRLWAKVTEGIKERNLEKATEAKTAIEEAQRQAVKRRDEKGERWQPKYFTAKGERFYPNISALPEALRPPVVQEYFAKRG